MSTLPEKISKYEVIGVAGRGAMGQVYLGHDPFIDRRVAIKVCAESESDDAAGGQTRRMFLNEARAAGALSHPNILRIYDADEAHGQLFIVMEYVEGGNNLKRYCTPGSLLPVETVVDYMTQCAHALNYAHSHGVLHRDIKPENILLTADDQAKVADFGIAQRLRMDATVAEGVFGSPLYMSPEQLDGRELSGLTDIYSLGVSMYELLTGRPPYTAERVTELVAKIATQAPPNILELRPDLPEAVAAVVMRAIQKPMNLRFASGADMAEALERAGRAAWGDLRGGGAEVDESQLDDILPSLEFFTGFSENELAQVREMATWRRFAPFEPIVTEGKTDRSLYILGIGSVSVRIGEGLVCRLHPGDCVGELAFLSGEPRSATVVAEEEVWALQLDDPLMDWASMPVQIRFSRTFERVLASRLRTTSRELARAVG